MRACLYPSFTHPIYLCGVLLELGVYCFSLVESFLQKAGALASIPHMLVSSLAAQVLNSPFALKDA